MKRPPLFSGSKTSLLKAGAASKGISLREEMDLLLYGSDTEPRQSFPVLIRRMRRNADGLRIACECKDTFSGDGNPSCPYCYGESFLWDEQWQLARSEFLGSDRGHGNRYRILPPGEVRVDYKIFFLRYDTKILKGDKIVEVKLDEEGNLVVPYVRIKVYRPETIDFLRSDNGRVEFITAYCLEKDALHLDKFK